MNSVFGDTIRKDIDYEHDFKTERWMETEYDEGLKNITNCLNEVILLKLKMLKDWMMEPQKLIECHHL